ncbi:Xaa-Pro peptidase family protein [Bacillus sp. FJAT-29814]|uniref:M24 family metallopeptidase n=1 Tax=Bacillus sp. FJAT-29814 TaxID=1729688 RepID=UPI00082D1C65|nr:Xaa-Pro peptidase family protein [Bacillus sp. FJAT-29814]
MLKQELLYRIGRLQKTLETHSIDSYIITAEEDIWYFTNITYKPEERPFFLVISPDQQPVLVVPKLEESHVYKGIIDCKVITYWDYPSPVGENWNEVLNDFIKRFGRTGIEDNVKAEVFLKIKAKELVPSQLIVEQRKLKSPYELEKIRSSARISDRAMEMIFKSVYKGATVIEPFALSRSVQTELIRTKQFDPITTSLLTAVWPAPISSMPHSIPNLGDRLGSGPNVAMAYFRINGYASECERTFFLENPTDEEEELFHLMMTARQRALKVLKAGARAADVDSEARNYLIKNGLSENLLHRTGHGVGLGNHEAPFIAEGSNEILEENMVITIEPGIYIDGVGGYRHSDTILVTREGYELLTTAPTELSDVIMKRPNPIAKLKGSLIQKSLKIE